MRLMAEIKYWHISLRQAEGKPVNAWLMYRLARVISQQLLPTVLVKAIKEQLQQKKALLQKKLCDLNCRETWLEGLVVVQAAETSSNSSKQLHHLLCTEKQ